MSQTKQLLSVVEDIRRLADSLQSLCEVMAEEKLEQTTVDTKSKAVEDEMGISNAMVTKYHNKALEKLRMKI